METSIIPLSRPSNWRSGRLNSYLNYQSLTIQNQVHKDHMMLLSCSVCDQGKDPKWKFFSFQSRPNINGLGEHERKKNKNYEKFQFLNL